MYKELENAMIVDAHWRHMEKEVQTFGECAGCQEDVFAGEDYYEVRTKNDVLKVHQKAECCQQFVADMAWCRVAGEE